MTQDKKTENSFLNPYVVVKEFGLKTGMSVADFGSGAGHFALALAYEVGDKGLVSAIDIREEVLEVLRGHVELKNLKQIKTIHGDLERDGGSTLHDKSQDLVLLSNILHQAHDSSALLDEARRILKQSGKLVLVDWSDDAPMGPLKKISQDKVKNLADEAGFTIKGHFDAGSYHWGLIFTLKE